MKFFGSVLQALPRWTAVIGIFLFCTTVKLIQADPTDDFSFTLAHAPELEVYSLMTEQRASSVLSDQLDDYPKAQAQKLGKHLISLCKRYRFDPAFVLSLIQVESRFRPRVHSPVGAVGLMQLMPATAIKMAREWDLGIQGQQLLSAYRRGGEKAVEDALSDPFVNMSVGVAYLSLLRDKYQGESPYYLVAAYNVGPGKVDSLRSRKSFRPVKTKKYYEDIRRGVPGFRFYRSEPRLVANAARS